MSVQRFKPNDAVFILPKYAHLYPGNSAVVTRVYTNQSRAMFNAYDVEFPDHAMHRLLEFQIIDDVPSYKTLMASLAFDSYCQAAAVQTRGSHSGRQVILQTPRLDLDMTIHTTESRVSIMGQVLERDTESLLKGVAEVRLMREGMPITTTKSDAVGVFRFKNVPTGTLNILVVLPHLFARVLGTVTI